MHGAQSGKKLIFMESTQNMLSENIKFSKNGGRMLILCLPEYKKETSL